MSKFTLPRDLKQISVALTANVSCPSCKGLSSWTKKKYCGYCCGSGLGWFLPDNIHVGGEAVEEVPDAKECETCAGKGVVITDDHAFSECPHCEGCGLLIEPCEYCQGKGTTTEEGYCDECAGAGVTDFVDHVADTADPAYIRYLMGVLLAAAGAQQEQDAVSAYPVLELLHKVRTALEDDGNDERLEELFGAFGPNYGADLIADSGRDIESVLERIRSREQETRQAQLQRERGEASQLARELSQGLGKVHKSLPDWVKDSDPYNA